MCRSTVCACLFGFKSSKTAWHRVTYLPYSIHLRKKSQVESHSQCQILNLRCKKVCQCCNFYLRCCSQGKNSFLDPLASQCSVLYYVKRSSTLLGVYRSVQINPIQIWMFPDLSPFHNSVLLDPLKGPGGYLRPVINVLGNSHNIDTALDFWMICNKIFFPGEWS